LVEPLDLVAVYVEVLSGSGKIGPCITTILHLTDGQTVAACGYDTERGKENEMSSPVGLPSNGVTISIIGPPEACTTGIKPAPYRIKTEERRLASIMKSRNFSAKII
jgi:hypothetical protein